MGESSSKMNKPRPKAAKGTTHKAPRVAKAAASAKMAGFESVGHQAATSFKQLNTAAMLSLAHERAGEHIKPVFFCLARFQPRPAQPLRATLTTAARRLQPRAWVSQCRC